MAKIMLVTGGARSGKSAFALKTAMQKAGERAFIATAQACDDEMTARIKAHKDERGGFFDTIEEPSALWQALERALPKYEIVLVDCLTVWLGNIFYLYQNNTAAIGREVEGLVNGLQRMQNDTSRECILVTNEVGWGIVPENAMARQFRDIAGRLNSGIGTIAHDVCLVACGIPLFLKGG